MVNLKWIKVKDLHIREYIGRANAGQPLRSSGHGERWSEPHASLIAITRIEGFRQLIFETYRNTNKYRNLLHNCKVAVLIEIGDASNSGLDAGFYSNGFW